MSDGPDSNDDLSPAATPLNPGAENGSLFHLEQRVCRLEQAVAGVQDTDQLAQRVAERITDRLGHNTSLAIRDPNNIVIEAGRRLLPAAVGLLQGDQPAKADPSHAWFFSDAYAEIRAMLHMYFDPRYHLTWKTRVLPLVLVAAILTSYFWVPGTVIPVVGVVLNKLVDLLLCYFLYKVLTREARRYRETAPDLPANLRL